MPPNISRFAEYELDRSAYQLRRKGRPVQLERIPLDLLFLLIDRRGHLVTREEIFESIWGKNFFLDVDNAINAAVRRSARALRDDPEAPRFVMTVPTKGYRFVAAVHEAKSQARYSDETSVRSTQSSIVGRERELASLLSGLDEAAAGRGRLMFLVSGEPGIGKTRLADEIAAVADDKGTGGPARPLLRARKRFPSCHSSKSWSGFVERTYGNRNSCAGSGERRDPSWRACCQTQAHPAGSASAARFTSRAGAAPPVQLLFRLRRPRCLSTTDL